jgi:hypothetical protein
VILRSQVIGVLVCYGRDPHRHSGQELELLQLVALLARVAIETVRVAEGQRRAVEELRDLSRRLREQNEELRRLSAMQSQLAEELSDPDTTTLEHTVRTLAELTRRAVLVAGRPGTRWSTPARLRSGRSSSHSSLVRPSLRRPSSAGTHHAQLLATSLTRAALPDQACRLQS